MRPRARRWDSLRRVIPWLILAIWVPGVIVAAYLVERSWAANAAELAKSSPAAKPLDLQVFDPSGRSTTKSAITLRGRVTPGSTVSVGRYRALVNAERFRVKVPVELGVNQLTLVARRSGYRTTSERVSVRRSKPRPEAPPVPTTQATPTTPQTPTPTPEQPGTATQP